MEHHQILHKREAEDMHAAATPPPLPHPATPIERCGAADAAGAAGRRINIQHAGANTGDKDDRALVALAKDRALAAAGIITMPQPAHADKPPAKETDPARAPVRGGVQAEIDR